MENEGIYDCVITNIPFSQNIDLNTSAYYYDGLAKKSGDGVCMLHCFKSVRKGGRMALIVPEGVLFKKTLSPIRKFLLENAKLETVISLPQGIFLPYTGVKTSILYFTGCHENSSKEGVWFYEVKNDGFSLNNHRRPIELNDLKYIDYVDFSNNQSLHTDIPLTTNSLGESLGFQKVEYENIKQNDYTLIFNRYSQACVARPQSVGKKGWEMVRLGDVVTLSGGGTPNTKESSYWENGNIPWITFTDLPKNDFITNLYDSKKKITSIGLKNSSAKLLPINTVILSSRATIGRVAITKVEMCTNQGFINIITSNKVLYYKYLAMYLKSIQSQLKELGMGATFSEISKSNFTNIQIPLPPLETQQKIVEELDNIQKGIDCLNQAIDSLKKQVNLDSFRFAHYFDGDV